MTNPTPLSYEVYVSHNQEWVPAELYVPKPPAPPPYVYPSKVTGLTVVEQAA